MKPEQEIGLETSVVTIDEKQLNFVKNPLYQARSIPLYKASLNDVMMANPYDNSNVNLSAIAYYGSLGMNTRTISNILNVPISWFRPKDSPFKKAFEAGQSLYELTLRNVIIEAAMKDPNLALKLLSRLYGSDYSEMDQNLPPEQQKSKFGRVIFGDTDD